MILSPRTIQLSAIFCAAFVHSSPAMGMDKKCADALQKLVDEKKMSLAFAQSVHKLVDAGPDKWITVKGQKLEGLIFQRGVSGDATKSSTPGLKAGGEEAAALLFAEPNTHWKDASAFRDVSESTYYRENVQSLFAFPLTVRGNANRVGIEKYSLPSPSFSEPIHPNTLVPSAIHSMGFFLPFESDRNYAWASNYLHLMKLLEEKQITPTPGSRGDKFLRELKAVWAKREIADKKLQNRPEITRKLTDLFLRYRIDEE